MPMELLKQLSDKTMPVEIADPKDVFNLYILKASGYVYATIPWPRYSSDGSWHCDAATVRQLTPLGATVLKYLKPINLTRAFRKTSVEMGKMISVDALAFEVPPQSAKAA